MFTWRTPFESVSIGPCSMRSAARRSRSASSPATARVIRPSARPRRVRLDDERGVRGLASVTRMDYAIQLDDKFGSLQLIVSTTRRTRTAILMVEPAGVVPTGDDDG